MEDILPVLRRLYVCRREAEGCRETGGKTENQENGEVDRKSKTPLTHVPMQFSPTSALHFCIRLYAGICHSVSHASLFMSGTQRQGKVQEIQVKCSKARNEYLLNLAAANASMNKYYLQDISTLIDVSLTHWLTLCQFVTVMNRFEWILKTL